MEFKIDFFFSSRRRHTRWNCDWSSDVCSSDLGGLAIWGTLAWVVWWRTGGWVIAALLIAGSICTRLPIYIPSLPLGTRALGVIILSLGLILALISLFTSAERPPRPEA